MDITAQILHEPNKVAWRQVVRKQELQQKTIKLNRVLINYLEDTEAIDYEKWRDVLRVVPYAMSSIPRCFNAKFITQTELHARVMEMLEINPLFWIHTSKLYRDTLGSLAHFNIGYLEKIVTLKFLPLLPYPGPLNTICTLYGNKHKTIDEDDQEVVGNKRRRDPPFDDMKQYTKTLILRMRNKDHSTNACVELCKMLYRINPLFFYGFPKEVRQILKKLRMDPLLEKHSPLVTSSLVFWLSSKKLSRLATWEVIDLMMEATWPVEVPIWPNDFTDVIHFLPPSKAQTVLEKYTRLDELSKLRIRDRWRRKTPLKYFKPSKDISAWSGAKRFYDCLIITK